MCVSHSVLSTLCNPMNCSPPGSSVHGILQTRILSRWPFPSSGDLPDPGIKPGSPPLQADTLLTELQAKPNLGSLVISMLCYAMLSHSFVSYSENAEKIKGHSVICDSENTEKNKGRNPQIWEIYRWSMFFMN